MKKTFTLIISILSLTTLSAQKNGTNELTDKRLTTRWDIPQGDMILRDSLADFTSDKFFDYGSAYLSGKLDGYNPDMGFNSFVITINNEVTRETESVKVDIDPSGYFSIAIPLPYAGVHHLFINSKKPIATYLEPGQTLRMNADWGFFATAYDKGYTPEDEANAVKYSGTLGEVNTELFGAKYVGLKEFSYMEMHNGAKSMTPQAYKEKRTRIFEDNMKIIEAAEATTPAAVRAKVVRRNIEMGAYGWHMMEYLRLREGLAKSNPQDEQLQTPVDDSYYTFLSHITLDERALMTDHNTSGFINRLERSTPILRAEIIQNRLLSPPPEKTFYRFVLEDKKIALTEEELTMMAFMDSIPPGTALEGKLLERYESMAEVRKKFDDKYDSRYYAEYEKKYWDTLKSITWEERHKNLLANNDSIYSNVFGMGTNSIVAEIMAVRDIQACFNQFTEKSKAKERMDATLEYMKNPFLRSEVKRLFDEKYNIIETKVYNLPKGEAADLFRKLIAPHKGKYIIVDFWFTGCGPCLGAMKWSMEQRRKYAAGNDIVFLYITYNSDSPIDRYNELVEQYELTHTHRLSDDEFNLLRELFNISGYPHYQYVNRKGQMMSSGLSFISLEYTLQNLLKNEK